MSDTVSEIGAEALVCALCEGGVNVFFANPGTSELHAVAAIDRIERARGILCLFEGVATGAADGYGRMADKPSAVLLHLGPGLSNGMANLHNARQAGTPMIVVVGEHSTTHLAFESPLNSDLARLPPYYSKAVWRLEPRKDIGTLAAAAIDKAASAPAGICTLIAPADAMWAPAASSRVGELSVSAISSKSDSNLVSAAADALRAGEGSAILLGGRALREPALRLASAIAKQSGARLFCETFNARHNRGAGLPKLERLPYFPEHAQPLLAKFSSLLLIGSKRPTSFFGSPEHPSDLVSSGTDVVTLADTDDAIAFLSELADAIGASTRGPVSPREVLPLPTGPLTPAAVWSALNNLMPAGAVVSDEAGVSSRGADEAMNVAEPHDWLNLTGGSIGQALAVATGASVAVPGAKVFAIQGDGGGLYTPQALWTQAREKLPVVTIIMNNRRYAILDYEAKRHGIKMGAKGASLFDLSEPAIDWAGIGQGFGVPSTVATSAEEFVDQLRSAIAADGPRLIDARLSKPSR